MENKENQNYSFFVIGDSKEGKNTLIEWINSAFKAGLFPKECYKDNLTKSDEDLNLNNEDR